MKVQGNKVLDDDGKQFIFLGIDACYGPFAGGDPDNPEFAASNIQRDLDYATKNLHINSIRLSIDIAYVDSSGRWSSVDSVVANATNRGLKVVISCNDAENVSPSRMQQLAARYANNSRVLITPANEPWADSQSWASWRTQEQAWVNAIRAGGNKQPIVLQCPGWSWDWSPYPNYALTDPAGIGLILGPHRYSNGDTSVSNATLNSVFGDLANRWPILMDEWGNYNEGVTGNASWNRAIGTYLVNLISRGGCGALGFTWTWSDDNALFTGSTLTAWGQQYRDYFLVPAQGASPPPSPPPSSTLAPISSSDS